MYEKFSWLSPFISLCNYVSKSKEFTWHLYFIHLKVVYIYIASQPTFRYKKLYVSQCKCKFCNIYKYLLYIEPWNILVPCNPNFLLPEYRSKYQKILVHVSYKDWYTRNYVLLKNPCHENLYHIGLLCKQCDQVCQKMSLSK